MRLGGATVEQEVSLHDDLPFVEKQDAQIKKLDIILEQLDGRHSTVNTKVEMMLPPAQPNVDRL